LKTRSQSKTSWQRKTNRILGFLFNLSVVSKGYHFTKSRLATALIFFIFILTVNFSKFRLRCLFPSITLYWDWARNPRPNEQYICLDLKTTNSNKSTCQNLIDFTFSLEPNFIFLSSPILLKWVESSTQTLLQSDQLLFIYYFLFFFYRLFFFLRVWFQLNSKES